VSLCASGESIAKSDCRVAVSPPKKQHYPWSKDVGAVPRTAQQARSGIGPYEKKAVSSIDNPVPKRGPWLAMTSRKTAGFGPLDSGILRPESIFYPEARSRNPEALFFLFTQAFFVSVCLTMNFVQPKWTNTLVLYALFTNLLLTTFLPPKSVGFVYIF
jgi:hypothetical protein